MTRPKTRFSRSRRAFLASALGIAVLLSGSALVPSAHSEEGDRHEFYDLVEQNARKMMDEGRRTFRFDTFGDEAFWGGALQLHQAIAGARNGGAGAGVSPRTALARSE